MRLKNLFSVPAEEKVTEKHLRRVLISSICSILLCMSCLAGTTWAWFVAGVENTENMIHIASPEVVVTVDGKTFASGETLAAMTSDEHTVTLTNVNGQQDAFGVRKNLYVTLLVDDTPVGYMLVEGENKSTITVTGGSGHKLSWTVSWTKPSVDAIVKNGDRFEVPANGEETENQGLENTEATGGETAGNDQQKETTETVESAEGETPTTEGENGGNGDSVNADPVNTNENGEQTK